MCLFVQMLRRGALILRELVIFIIMILLGMLRIMSIGLEELRELERKGLQ